MSHLSCRPTLSPSSFLRLPRLLAALWGLGLLLPALPVAAAGEPPLLTLLSHRAGVLAPSSAVLEARPVAVDLTLLDQSAPAVSLSLLDGSVHRVVRTAFERHGDGAVTWWGRLDGAEDGWVVISHYRGAVGGGIYTAGAVYELLPSPAGTLLARFDSAAAPPCSGGVEPPQTLAPRQDEAPLQPLAPRDSAAVIDALVLYTATARAQAGGEAAIVARIRAAVGAANGALANSQVSTRFRLVGALAVAYDEARTIDVDLRWLATDAEVAALRNQFGADLVSLIIHGNGGAGIGYLMSRPGPGFAPRAFQVTHLDYAVGNLTWAHENGHNMGAEHDPPNGNPPAQASYPFSFGHAVDGSFRTVMSYPTTCTRGCSRAPHYSNPAVRFAGQPTGIANQRDNHRTLNLTAGIVANFRQHLSSAPAAPTGLAVERRQLDAELTWNDEAGNEAGYRIWRGIDGGGLDLLAELPADATYFVDRGLPPDSEVRYSIGAYNQGGEARGEEVAITVPPLLPVTVDLVEPPVIPTPMVAGELVTFFAATTGPVERAEWRFAPGELGRSPAPAPGGAIEVAHVFRSPGTHPVEVTVVGDLGQTATAAKMVTVTGPVPDLPASEGVVQSVVFGPRGDTGTFETNCWAHNDDDMPLILEIAYLPRGAGNPDPERRWLTVPPQTSFLFENVVSSLFGESDSQGSLGLRTLQPLLGGPLPGAFQPRLFTHCRSFVSQALAPGSFGQLVGEERAGVASAEPKLAPAVYEGDGLTSVLLAVNRDDRPGRVTVELLDAAGAAVGDPVDLLLGRRGMRQRPLPELFDTAGRTGPFTARFTSNGIRFAASVTLLELGTDDPIFIPARVAGGSGPLFVPRVTRAASQFDAFLVSRLVAHNPAPSATELTIELWLRGQDNSTPQTAQRTLAPGSTLEVVDLFQELFGLDDGVGALRILWSNPDGVAPRVASLAFNQVGGVDGAGPRFGMLVDAVSAPPGAATNSAVAFGAEQSSRFRADFGLVNLNDGPTRVAVTLRDGDGTNRAQGTLMLKPQQHLERNVEGIFPDVAVGMGRNWTIATEVEAGGPVLPYLANINVTGDVFFVPGRW